jgi:hypothetical protein
VGAAISLSFSCHHGRHDTILFWLRGKLKGMNAALIFISLLSKGVSFCGSGCLPTAGIL